MVHLRIVAPHDSAQQAVELLTDMRSVCNVVHLEGVARNPDGDLILCDVAREEASIVLDDLRELGIDKDGSIAMETIDAQISEVHERAEEYAKGAPSDAVVWEEVEERTSENVELAGVFLAFMVLAALIAATGVFLDSPILIVGAMVVGPEFGPIAGLCVAIVQRRRDLATRSALALAVGFPLAIAVVYVAVQIFKATGVTPDTFNADDHHLSDIISSPDFFSFFVAACAGAAGMLSLSTAKSGALIGVLISVTTIPAAANIGVAAAYQDWPAWRGSLAQLGLNMLAILLSGTAVLTLQRLVYRHRREKHLNSPERRDAGLPVGRSRPTVSRKQVVGGDHVAEALGADEGRRA